MTDSWVGLPGNYKKSITREYFRKKNYRKHVEGLPTGFGMFYAHTFISIPTA